MTRTTHREGQYRSTSLRQTASEEQWFTEYIQPCTQSFKWYREPYLEKGQWNIAGGLLFLVNIKLNLIFVVFVDCFWNTRVQSDLLYALVFICVAFWNGDAASLLSQKYPNISVAFHLVPEQRGGAGALSCLQSLCLPGGTLYQKKQTAKTQKRRARRCLMYMSVNEKQSSIIFQFAATLKTLKM